MMTVKRTKRAALWATLLMLAASLCGGCLIAAADDGASGGLSTTELVTAPGADITVQTGTATNESYGNGIFDGGLTITGDTQYAGSINGVFEEGEAFALRFGFFDDGTNTYNKDDEFTFTIADVADPDNSFRIRFNITNHWTNDEGSSGYTGAHVYYGDEVRTARYWDGEPAAGYKSGDYALHAPQFPGCNNGQVLQGRWGVLSLEWTDGVLSVRVPSLQNGNDYGQMRTIAKFDGTEAFAMAGTSKDGWSGTTWGLPELSFPEGYTVSFETGATAPDVYFHSIRSGEAADSPLVVDFTTQTQETEPEFYTAWNALPALSRDKVALSENSEITYGFNGVAASGITLTAETDTGAADNVIGMQGAINGVFSGDLRIDFAFPHEFTGAGPTEAEFEYIIQDRAGEEIFRIRYSTQEGWYNHVAVVYGDQVRSYSRARVNYGTADNWDARPTIFYRMPRGEQQGVYPGTDTGQTDAGYVSLVWEDDILSVRVPDQIDSGELVIARFDGTVTDTIPESGYEEYKEGETVWGLDKVYDRMKDGYTVSFAAEKKFDYPVTFISINGVSLNVEESIRVPTATEAFAFDLVEDEGNYYVMQNDGDFDMTTTTTYGLTDGWTIEDSVTAPYAGSDIDVMTPDTYTVGGATVVVEPAYTVTYETAGGGKYPAQTFSAHYKEAVVLPSEPTKAGYLFGGWFNGQTAWTGTSGEVAALSGNTTITAAWTAEEYDITYNANGGTGAEDGTYTIESETITLPTPTKTGYTFGGWYENETFAGNAVTEIAAGTVGDKTFYAKWTAVEYDITYNANGGTGAENGTYTIESETITLPTPTRTGYTFGGWYEDETFAGSAVTEIAAGTVGDKTFYAKWTENATDEPGEPDDEPGDDPNDPAGPTDPGDSGDGEADGGCGCGGVLAASSAIPAALALAAGGALLFRRKRSGDNKRQ